MYLLLQLCMQLGRLVRHLKRLLIHIVVWFLQQQSI